MTDDGSGWFREEPEHALAAKGISLGRKKTAGVQTQPKPEIEAPTLSLSLVKPEVTTKSNPHIVIPEQKIEIPHEKLPETIETVTGEKEYGGQEIFGIKIDSPETAFTDFFGGLGEAFVMDVEQAGESVGSSIFPSDKSAGDVIDGSAELGSKSEALNIAEESFGAAALDNQFQDMAKTKIELNYLETPDDELEAEALAQEERQIAGIAPTLRAGEAVGERAGEAVGLVGGKIKAGVAWAKERFRREQGRDPSPEEEAVMADQIAEQVVGGQDIPEEPVRPAPPPQSVPPVQPPMAQPERQISEQEAQEIVNELERQRLLKENGGM